MCLNGTEYKRELHYGVREIAPAEDDATSSIDAAGNITIGKKNSAFVTSHCDAAGWSDPRIKAVGQ